MIPDAIAAPTKPVTSIETTGPATLAQVMEETEAEATAEGKSRLRPLTTGFDPLDDILNGGVRPGELLIVGGSFGVGKTIWGLQVAHHVACTNPDAMAMYICYEHDRAHLMSRLMCLESVECGCGDNALTLRTLAELALGAPDGVSLLSRLRDIQVYAPVVKAMTAYALRLILVKASGERSTLSEVQGWVEEALSTGPKRLVVIVDYLQKIPVDYVLQGSEAEATTRLAQGLKEMALSLQIPIIAITASDRPGLKAKRLHLTDLRGSSALQYEADVGLVLHNKYAIVSREHLVYNLSEAESMRNWIVMSVEKNRAGRSTIDMEHALDAAHFRIAPTGRFVRERLIDEKVVLE
jgi:replicative DNA helicase